MTENDITHIKFDPRDPKILDKISDSYHKVIVGEDDNIKFLFCGYVSKDLPRKYRLHTIIASQSSSGKTSLVRRVGEPFQKYVVDYTSFTTAFLKRQPESMDGKILLIEQLEKTNDKKQASFFELKFLMSEGKLKVGVADRDEKGNYVPTILEVTGIPVVVTTSTNMRIDPESLNRVFLTQADESKEQTERIVDFTLKSFSTLDINETWKEELLHLQSLAEKYHDLAHQISDIKIPFAEKLKKSIPCENLTIRRDLPKILSLTCVIAFIHASNRYRIQDNNGAEFIVGSFGETEKRYLYSIIAEPDDFREALEIAGSAIKQTLNKVNDVSMKIYGKIIEMYNNKTYQDATLDGNGRVEGVTIKDIAEKISKSTNRTRELVSQLEAADYLIADRSTKVHTFIPTGRKFSEIKMDDITFSHEELETWLAMETAKHGKRLTAIPPSCQMNEVKDDTK